MPVSLRFAAMVEVPLRPDNHHRDSYFVKSPLFSNRLLLRAAQ
jgi:hypothetical protein